MKRTQAHRHYCLSEHSNGSGSLHSKGSGKAREGQRCRYCGGQLATESGVYGLFVWSGGNGRYFTRDALALYLVEKRASAEADRRPHDNVVVRWLTGETLESEHSPAPRACPCEHCAV